MMRSQAMIPFLFQVTAEEARPWPVPNPSTLPSPDEAMDWARWLHQTSFRGLSLARVQQVLEDVVSLFHGRFPGYDPCDTHYHDLEHTLRLIPPFCRIVVGLLEQHRRPISSRDVELGLIAVLLHDAGYIREHGDTEGTGAKYTFRHIERSVAFARDYLRTHGYTPRDLTCVEEMICCTGVKAELEQDHFLSKACRLLGYALGTADLLAQMADPNYLDKLPLLYQEFQEAYAFEGEPHLHEAGIQRFENAEALIRMTPLFHRHVVVNRLKAMGNLHALLEDPRTGRNPYLDSIQGHLDAIAGA